MSNLNGTMQNAYDTTQNAYEKLLKERENMLIPKEKKIDNLLSNINNYKNIDNGFNDYMENVNKLKFELKKMKKELIKFKGKHGKLNEIKTFIDKFKKELKEKFLQNVYDSDFTEVSTSIRSKLTFDNKLNGYINNITKELHEKQNNFYLLHQKYKENVNKVSELLKSNELEDEIINNETSCPICYDNKVTHCINPCGHTFCSNCVKEYGPNAECFMCRTKIKSIIKMFMTFSEENNDSENNVVPANTNFIGSNLANVLPNTNYVSGNLTSNLQTPNNVMDGSGNYIDTSGNNLEFYYN